MRAQDLGRQAAESPWEALIGFILAFLIIWAVCFTLDRINTYRDEIRLENLYSQ
jgi:hypothetical protein